MQSDSEQQRIRSAFDLSVVTSDPFAAAVRATRMPMVVTDPRRPDNPIIFCNDAFGRLTGYSREETMGRNCRFLQGSGTDREDVARVAEAIRDRKPIEIDLLNYRKDGETFWNRLLVSPVFDNGELTYFFASQFDVTVERERLSRLRSDRANLEAQVRQRVADLAQSEERLSFALRAGGLGAWTLDLATGNLNASNICRENFGRGAGDDFSYADLREAMLPEDRGRWRETVERAVAEGTDFDAEYRVRASDGGVRWVEMRGQPGRDASGRTRTLAGVSLDVTERKLAEEHRHLLVRELNHRVKNTLATVQSIVRQSLRATNSVEEAGDAADARIRALSTAHDVLTEESWSGAAMRDIAVQTLRPFLDASRPRIRVSGDPVRLKPRAALAVSMALHELATNAVKYGALSNDAGTVAFTWSARLPWDETEGAKGVSLRWEETNGPPVAEPTRRGFGSRLIERALANELNGAARIEYRPSGVIFTVDAGPASLATGED